jgi:hypothetical protein
VSSEISRMPTHGPRAAPGTPFEADVKGTKYRGIVDSACDAEVRAKFETLGVGGTWQPHPDRGLFLPEEITAAGPGRKPRWPEGGRTGAGRRRSVESYPY